MATDPNAQPLSATADSPVTNASPQGPVSADPLPLPGESVSSEAAQASSPTPEAIVRALIDALDHPAQADAPEERDS